MTDDAGRKALADEADTLLSAGYATDMDIAGAWRFIKKAAAALRTPLPATASREAIVPLPGELAFIQVLWKALNHIANYSPVSRIQPVLIARDAIKEANALTFESEPIKAALAPVQSATREALDNSQSLLAMIYQLNTKGSVSEYDWENVGLSGLITAQITENRHALSSVPADERGECCKGLAPVAECRCEQERTAQGHPSYHRGEGVSTPTQPSDRDAVVEGWQPIETAPKNKTVQIAYLNRAGKWRMPRAIYYPENTLELDNWDELESQYAPPGWYESTVEGEEPIQAISGAPTHWQPLPAPPSLTPSERKP